MNVLKSISFGNEAGDDVDFEELRQYFIRISIFDVAFDINNKISLITAKKGMGKSALLKYLHYKILEDDSSTISIFCRGSELTRTQFNIQTKPETPNEYIRDWLVRLSAIANRNIASRMNIPLSGNDLSIIESAEIEGFKEKNFLFALLERFKKLVDKYYPTEVGIKNEIKALQRNQDTNIVFVIDDLDATFQNTERELLELSTFFSAVRYMTQDIKGVRFRISLRSSVWTDVRKYDEALDKMVQYQVDLVWEKANMSELINERILSEIKRKKELGSLLISTGRKDLQPLIIENTMAWGGKSVDSFQVIYTLSYGRPRWAIQLLKAAQTFCLKNGAEKISKYHIDNIWEEYGNKRIADLVAEHKHQCSELLNLINSFRGAERKMDRDVLFSYINKHFLSHYKPIIEQITRDRPIDIAQFLYKIGFIIGRIEFEDESYRHLFFENYPDLLKTHTSNDFNAKWEIHPCYREALSIKKLSPGAS